MKLYFLLPTLIVAIAMTSCGEKLPEHVKIPEANPNYSGEQAVKVRDETIIEISAIKAGVQETIFENSNAPTMDKFISDLESFRPRLEYIRMQTKKLPKKEQMVVRGNLAVISNKLDKELLNMLAKSPGNDDLAVEIAHIRKNLSPIPLENVLQKF